MSRRVGGGPRAAGLVALICVAALCAPSHAQVRIGIEIGYRVPSYPTLRLVPGVPVYYAPGVDANYFFYDGMYWIFLDDAWYSSAWYDGPWQWVGPGLVPDYLLRVPVGYYATPPRYFQGWQRDAPPRWGEHWGAGWERQRRGWDHWNHDASPAAAPLPQYQQRYSGANYPRPEQQGELRHQQDRYQPRDPAVRKVLDAFSSQPIPQRGTQRAPPPVPSPMQQRPTQPELPPPASTGSMQHSAQPTSPPSMQHSTRAESPPPRSTPMQAEPRRPAPAEPAPQRAIEASRPSPPGGPAQAHPQRGGPAPGPPREGEGRGEPRGEEHR